MGLARLLMMTLAVVLGSEASFAQQRQTTDYLGKTPTAEELIEALLPERPEAIHIEAVEPEVQLNITFEFDSAELASDSLAVLDNLAKAIGDPLLAELTILVEGHTDSVGSNRYNMTLSERRANAVKVFLSEQGVSRARLDSKGLGEGAPVAPNNSSEGRQRNRRVEIINMGSAK